MKQFSSFTSFISNSVLRKIHPLFAAATMVAIGIGGAGPVTPIHADDGGQKENTQVAALDQLLAGFHGALSYGGNIDAMMALWADDSSISLNGVAHVGKDAVRTFFVTGGYFLHQWVSLAPEYKTQITIHGNTAEASTQCVAVDITATPPVVRSVIQVNAVAIKQGDHWMFVSMDNTTPAPL